MLTPRRLAFVVLVFPLAPALAAPRPRATPAVAAHEPADKASQDALNQAEDQAREKSRAGDYEGAAQLIGAWRSTYGAPPALESNARALQEIYAARAKWKAAGPKDIAAQRALLHSLLTESAERADAADPRVKEILASLRIEDPAAKALFQSRRVKVAASASDVPATLVQLFADRVADSLKTLGFGASPNEGDESLALSVSRRMNGDVSALFGESAPGPHLLTCTFAGTGRWTGADGSVVLGGLDVRATAGGLDDEACFAASAKAAGEHAATAILLAWLRANP